MSKNVVPCGGFELSDMLNVDKNGKLGISESTPYQQLVTDGEGKAKWEDRLGYKRIGDIVFWSGNDVVFSEHNGIYFGGSSFSSSLENPQVDYFIVKFDDAVYKLANRSYGYGNAHLASNSADDTGEPLFIEFNVEPESRMYRITIYTNIVGDSHNVEMYYESEQYIPIPEQYMPEMSSIILKSSTASSTKKFKITVNDSGTITATEV